MRLLAHLVFADVRRHRWLLCFWLAALVATTVIQGVSPALVAEPAAANSIALLDGLLTIMRLLLRILLIALVVQTHPLVGSDAFWLTRPIPPLMLLRAKAVVLAIFFVLAPVAAEAVLTTVYGVPRGEIVRVALDSAVFAALWVALLATAAALTPTFPRFMLLCGGVLATLALYVAVGVTINSTGSASPPVVAQPQSVDTSAGLVVVVAMLILACTATLIAQYRSRRIWRSALVAVTLTAVALIGSRLWPWPVLQANVERPAWATGEASLPIVAHAAAVRSREEREAISTALWRHAAAPIHVSGLQPGWSAGITVLQATLQLDGGRTLTGIPSGYYSAPVTTDYTTPSRDEAIRGLIGASRFLTGSPPDLTSATAPLLVVSSAEFARVAPVTGQYRGRFYLQLTRHQIEAMLPLRPGAEARNGSYWLVVDSALASSSRLMELRVRESDATSSFDRRPRAQRTYYLRNRRSGVALEGDLSDFEIGLFPRMFNSLQVSRTAWNFQATGSALRFGVAGWIDKSRFDAIDDTWLRDADLIVVRSTPEAGMERRLEIDRFPLDAMEQTETRTAR